jgi:hypothetical protein
MRRGDIWTVAGGKDYADKARPVVIIQRMMLIHAKPAEGRQGLMRCNFRTGERAIAHRVLRREDGLK